LYDRNRAHPIDRQEPNRPDEHGGQAMPFTVLQSAFDGLYPPGLQWYWRADFFDEISDAAIEVHRQHFAATPTGHSTMHLYPIDGAASRRSSDATAFAY
jgi:hypothetical protein